MPWDTYGTVGGKKGNKSALAAMKGRAQRVDFIDIFC